MNKESLQGKAEKLTGRAKESAGNLTGNDRLKAGGARDQLKGELRDTWGAAKKTGHEAVKGAKEGSAKASRANHP